MRKAAVRDLQILRNKYPTKEDCCDEDVAAMLVPGSERPHFQVYNDLISNKRKLDQLSAQLLKRKRLPDKIINKLIWVLGRVDNFTFVNFRDNKISYERMLVDSLNLPKGALHIREDFQKMGFKEEFMPSDLMEKLKKANKVTLTMQEAMKKWVLQK